MRFVKIYFWTKIRPLRKCVKMTWEKIPKFFRQMTTFVLNCQFSRFFFNCRYFFTNGSSVAYPNKTISSTQSLMSWTKYQVNHPSLVTWIGTAGRKSLNLAKRLEHNSKYSLLVFLNRKHRYVNIFFNFRPRRG